MYVMNAHNNHYVKTDEGLQCMLVSATLACTWLASVHFASHVEGRTLGVCQFGSGNQVPLIISIDDLFCYLAIMLSR